MLDSETYKWLFCDPDELIDVSSNIVRCEDCKWFEPFNAICCNGESEYCAGCPMDDGVIGCKKGELKGGESNV